MIERGQTCVTTVYSSGWLALRRWLFRSVSSVPSIYTHSRIAHLALLSFQLRSPEDMPSINGKISYPRFKVVVCEAAKGRLNLKGLATGPSKREPVLV